MLHAGAEVCGKVPLGGAKVKGHLFTYVGPGLLTKTCNTTGQDKGLSSVLAEPHCLRVPEETVQ